ncbi:hypothetical protein AVEN_140712-1 [Araneus ventricosus]|uniref:Retrovirus-related Pol polyprotein from transposon TNT 1-94-like beta-barrel domain-containing protein n=1 Tax=Araneus ventricosus TaxID=182803 RepID=A0A4Y2KD36_ARAVE|nr:hypothetical protein AVEN_140712-1 [Araneus ventricosus]
MLKNNKPFKNNNGMLEETNETKQKVTFNTVLSCADSQINIFCLDSGGTSHMCFNEHLFSEIYPIDDTYVKSALDKTVKTIAKGNVTFDVLVGNEIKGITLQNMLYIPNIKNDLISISKVTANNFTVKFLRSHASVINSEHETVLIAKREKDLYCVTAIVKSVSIMKEIEQWDQKFPHLNEKDLKKLQAQNMMYGKNFKPSYTLTDCKVCIQASGPRIHLGLFSPIAADPKLSLERKVAYKCPSRDFLSASFSIPQVSCGDAMRGSVCGQGWVSKNKSSLSTPIALNSVKSVRGLKRKIRRSS